MPAVLLGTNAYKRTAGNFPEIVCINRYFEADPTNAVDGVALLARPALVPGTINGSGVTRGAFKQSGVLGGDTLQVVGSNLWRITAVGVATNVGNIAGTDDVEFASDGANTLIAAGTLYVYDGATLGIIVTPDGVGITSLDQFNGFFLLQVEGSDRFYWTQPGEIIIDPLDFATAEKAPDIGVAIRVVGDFIALLNAASTEFWGVTGDPDAPFQRQQGLLFEKGCSDRRTAFTLDNSLFWVGETSEEGRVVYRGGSGEPERVSEHGIEERMRGVTELSALTFTFDGHAFYVLRIEGVGTFVYDVSNGGNWSEFASFGRSNWRVRCAAQAPGGPVLLGDDETGQLWTLSTDVGNDDGVPIVRTVTAVVPVLGQIIEIECLSLQASVGWAPDHTFEPQIEMRLARDLFTFSNWKARGLGLRGQFKKRVRYERCGEARPPGILFELRDSDNAQTRLSYCRYNEPY